MRQLKVGLALGGGGARGMAHIGVLRVLEREKIPIDIITGTSIGAIIGAIYALNPSAEELESRIIGYLNSEAIEILNMEMFKDADKQTFVSRMFDHIKQTYIYSLSRTRISLISEESMDKIINALLPDKQVNETVIPFAAVATDLIRGTEVVFTEGPIRMATKASIAIAGVFPPCEMEGNYFVDGGATSEVPVRAAFQLGADVVIAIDVKSRMRRRSRINTGAEVMRRVNYIRGTIINEILINEADLVISPAVKNIHWMNFKKAKWCVRKGEQTTVAKIEFIRKLIKNKMISTFIKRLFN